MAMNACSTFAASFALVSIKDSNFICECFSCFIWHNFVCYHITVVANQKFVNIITSIAINFAKPLLHIIEALFIFHIINNNDPICPMIVATGDRPKSFLPGCVLNLKFNGFPILLDGTYFAINSNGAYVALDVWIIRKPQWRLVFQFFLLTFRGLAIASLDPSLATPSATPLWSPVTPPVTNLLEVLNG